MSTQGYGGETTPVVGPLTSEQRQRLESVTFARALLKSHQQDNRLEDWLRLAEYIHKGKS